MFSDFISQLNVTELLIFFLTTVGGTLAVWYRKRLIAWKKYWESVITGMQTLPELQVLVRDNNGNSIIETMSRTEAAVQALTQQVDLIVQTMWVENDSDDEVGRFHRNSTGQNTYVNQLYARWLGVGKTELMGLKYLSFVHPDDVDRFRQYWNLCMVEHRQCRITYRMITAEGTPIEVESVATPIPESPPAHRWIGSIRRLDRDRRQQDTAKAG